MNDLTHSYILYVLKQGDIRRYEAAFPQLFAHYYAYYAEPMPYSFRDEGEILRRRELMLQRLSLIAQRFKQQGLPLEGFKIVLFVGHGTSNGHAFPLEGQWVVWLPLETYPTPTAMDIFFTHEIAHALHYQRQPDFFYRSEAERTQVFRQLVTEGLATLFSKELLNVSDELALWGDYLPQNDVQRWYQQCQQREEELFRMAFENLWISDSQNRLFSYSDSDDVAENRAGYYIGLRLIEYYMKNHGLHLQGILGIRKAEFSKMFRNFLERGEYLY
ncbi:MAG: DUF2268 domain-containing protein [Anaerolineales bacterium]|nr:DUF2268 domain-containing protein [Anaerolineales bacterium]